MSIYVSANFHRFWEFAVVAGSVTLFYEVIMLLSEFREAISTDD
jgi:hypothetical protein